MIIDARSLEIHPEVARFIQSAPHPLFINGRGCEAADGRVFEVRDPGRGEVIARVSAGGAKDIDRAVEAARAAFHQSGWAAMPANDRAVLLHRLADLAEKHFEALAQLESWNEGKPLADTRAFDVPQISQTLRYFADMSVHVRRREPIAVKGFEARTVLHPYGVCAFILPWNCPVLLMAWGIAPALAAGNTVVVKPAEDTPLSALYLCKLAQEAGIPPGVLNVVPGLGETAGAALAGHPGIQRMSFTGSPEVGRSVAEACGRNLVPVKLELGGKGAAVLFEDIDVDAAAQALAGAVTLNAGQVCCTATRWLVHERIWNRLVDKATEALKGVKIGHGLAAGTQMGPVINSRQRSRILSYLDRGESEGAEVILRGGAASVPGAEEGYYVKPALLTGRPDNVCAREEIFGPVAYLVPFKEEGEAVDLVNRSPYGLGNSVWTRDLERARRVAEAMVCGISWINGHNMFTHGIPYGGCKQSGLGGGVNSPDTFRDYLRGQSVVRSLT